MNRLIDFLLSLLKKRLLLIVILGTTAVVLSVVFGSFIFKALTKPKKVADTVVTSTQELTIVIPDGAYSKSKFFQVKRISPSELHPSLTSVFASNVYEVFPSDGVNEFAMEPITIRYRLPSNLYLGDEYANVAIGYIPNPKEPLYRVYGGAYIQTDPSGAYVEAQVFHVSTIGLVAYVPEKQKLGLQLIKENPRSIEPVLLLIPDVDRNFLGFVSTEGKQQINFWSELFPERTIMYYEYPIISTKSKAYMDGFRQFSRINGINSFLFYEASKLATELMRLSNLEFDIVAHGIGGIIARLAVEKYPQVKNVRKIVLVSTPSGGTNIVNPIYFGTFFYEKPSQTVARNFGTESSIVDAAKAHILFYLESLGPIYREVLPKGTAVNLLGDKRQDIDYLSIVGDRPPMSINFSKTILEQFYPELSVGDGIVTPQSARIQNADFAVVAGSFLDCYLSVEFQSKIKDFLKYEKPVVPLYRKDTYPERVPQARVTERVSPQPVQSPQRVMVTVPTSYNLETIARLKERMDATGVISLHQAGSTILLHRIDGLYSSRFRIFSGEVRYPHTVAGKMGFVSGSKAYLFDGKNFTEVGTLSIPGNCLDILVTAVGIYALTKSDKINLFRWDNRWQLVGRFDGEYAKFVDADKPTFLTNHEVYRITNSGVELLVRTTELGLKEKSTDLTCFYETSNFIFLGTRAYYLLVYNKTDKSFKIVAEGWIDPQKILSSGDWVVTVGTSTLLFFDVKNQSFKSEIQKMEGQVKDAVIVGKDLYVLADNRIDVFTLP
ncbi:lipase family protein [Pseudothermotoga thermarum]|uniref:PGAP1 family protein n=1 Tax=Pseudothermotoga thermarum DSM 5069 TaxID=688269 RepID=F7YVW7_9THEM|nr:hypothetical protein [Pseudothermotoga thermarum]AEH51789.1 hypothetical protein Theth_1745 [Pseudothermotoga thermarum DSM 5069]